MRIGVGLRGPLRAQQRHRQHQRDAQLHPSARRLHCSADLSDYVHGTG
jgi:hypothetical protein